MYVRKTHDEYQIHADYGYGMEYVCSAKDREEAKKLLKGYKKKEPGILHAIKKKRIPN